MDLANKVKTDEIKAIIYTNRFKIVGKLHLLLRDSYRGRLSDHLNSGQVHNFIPVTDAVVYDASNNNMLYETKCIIINKRSIEGLIEEN
ncbi:MAG: hypothetical protein C4562_00480 [Actinobacteria bacterium]|nr:MAG: hypothetical protein C4562_00480 [Actinomycetota bacterium]